MGWIARWLPVLALLSLGGCIDTGGLTPGPDGGAGDDGGPDDDRALTATFIDVGQGDAALFEMPDGSTVLIDGGPDGAGVGSIVPLLWDKGIATIDLLVLTHPHADHCGGLDEVLQVVEVVEIWENGETLETAAYLDFAAARDAEAAALLVVGAGEERSYGGALLTVLSADRQLEGENDDSIVIAVDFAGRRLLTTGDVEWQAQSLLVEELGAGLASAVVKVPHHGSWNFAAAFVEAVAADFGVVSSGAGNPYGHPHQLAIDAWLAEGTVLCRTDISGDVIVTISAAGEVTFDCDDPIRPVDDG